MAERDITGWCAQGRCANCDGTLHTGRDFHWFCSCACHPEPTRKDDAPTARESDFAKALEVYHKARE